MSKFFQAVKWLEEGKKVRRSSWIKPDSFLIIKGSVICSKNGEHAYFCIDHFKADDWEIFEEKLKLSDKIIEARDPTPTAEVLFVSDVKEFIRRLREKAKNYEKLINESHTCFKFSFIDELDKLAGDELNGA